MKRILSYYELDNKSKCFTATITLLGLMAYNRLAMGLKDAASVFQKSVSRALENCTNTIAIVDNILVFGSTKSEHDSSEEHFISLSCTSISHQPFFWHPGGHIFRVLPEQRWHPPQPRQDSTNQRGPRVQRMSNKYNHFWVPSTIWQISCQSWLTKPSH